MNNLDELNTWLAERNLGGHWAIRNDQGSIKQFGLGLSYISRANIRNGSSF